MEDNIKVSVRVRSLNYRESHDERKCVSVTDNLITLNSVPSKAFCFDIVCNEHQSQREVFDQIAKPIVLSCLEGYNGTIFAYGQTGAGKTYTISGPEDNPGILPRSLEFIFNFIQSSSREFLLKASYVEIYNECINDLFNADLKNLQIREDMKKGAYVEGMTEETVTNISEAMSLLERGSKNRHIGDTLMNRESSRSHSVFTLNIESKDEQDGILSLKSSRFHLIDLAGSERQKLTAATGERLKEAGMINKSLSALGNVINSLVEKAEGRSRHIHYRDSKLTFLLKDSIGGNAKTCIIANVSPSVLSFGETLSTLRFAERAKLVKNAAKVNEDTMGTVAELKLEIKRLKDKLSRRNDNSALEDRVRQLERQLSEEQNNFSRSKDQLNALLAKMEADLTKNKENSVWVMNKFIDEIENITSAMESQKESIDDRDMQLKETQKTIDLLQINQSKTQEVLRQRDEIIQDLEEQIRAKDNMIEILSSENQYLTLSLSETKSESSQKDAIITELKSDAVHKETLKVMKEEILDLKNANNDLLHRNLQCEHDTKLYRKIKDTSEFELNNIKQELDQLLQQIRSKDQENENLKREIENLSDENASLVGHNNSNQKIKIHIRLKEENNKLKEMNYRLKEDARKMEEKYKALLKVK